jgi:hypothetical protein
MEKNLIIVRWVAGFFFFFALEIYIFEDYF